MRIINKNVLVFGGGLVCPLAFALHSQEYILLVSGSTNKRELLKICLEYVEILDLSFFNVHSRHHHLFSKAKSTDQLEI